MQGNINQHDYSDMTHRNSLCKN